MKLSIIIPAHNEEKRIGKTLEDYCRFFNKRYKKDFEIIVVLNGCSDRTIDITKKFKKKYSQIRYLDFRRSGKGFAVIEGFKSAEGDLIGFADADDSTSAEEFNKLIKKIDGFDGAIASRYAKGAVMMPAQPIQRRIVSRAGNLIINLLFHLNISDTQCGAKLFRKDAVKKAIPHLGTTEWGFDIDLLYQMKKQGARIKEVPIVWRDCAGSKLNLKKASLQVLLATIRLRFFYSPFRKIIWMMSPIIGPLWMELKK